MKKKYVISYIVYGVIITVIFLYLLFPSEMLRKYVVLKVTNNNPNIILAISKAKLAIPVALQFEDVVIRFKDKPGATLEADTIKAWPALTSLIRKKLSFRVMAKAFQGQIEARIIFPNGLKPGEPITLNTDLSQLNMEQCSYLKKVLRRQIKGILSGTLSYEGKYDEIVSGTGTADLILQDGNIELLKNMFGFDTLAFDEVTASMTLKNRNLKINKANLTGKQVRGSLNGNILIERDVAQSRLSLRGTAEIPALNKTFTTFVSGTLNNPIPRLK